VIAVPVRLVSPVPRNTVALDRSPLVSIVSKVTVVGPFVENVSTPFEFGPSVSTALRSAVIVLPWMFTASELAPVVLIVPSDVKITSSTAVSDAPIAPSPAVVMLVTSALMPLPDVMVRPGPVLVMLVTPSETRLTSASPMVPSVTGPFDTKPSASVTSSGSVALVITIDPEVTGAVGSTTIGSTTMGGTTIGGTTT